MNKTVFSIDPGIGKCGYAFQSNTELFEFGVITTEVNGNIGKRLIELETDLTYLLQKAKPDVVVIEEPMFTGNYDNASLVQRAYGIIILTCAKCGHYEPVEISPPHIKKVIIGDGRAKKKDLKAPLSSLYGRNFSGNDDALDAIAVGKTYLLDLQPELAERHLLEFYRDKADTAKLGNKEYSIT